MGLDDHLKFKVNQRSAQDLLCEAFGFTYAHDPCPEADPPEAARRLKVGFNTGCGPKWPLKKIGLQAIEASIACIAEETGEPVLLLGGPEDTGPIRCSLTGWVMRLSAVPQRMGSRRGSSHESSGCGGHR